VLDSGGDYTWPAAGVLTYGGTGITATGAELNYLDLTTGAGTGEASKAVVLDANGDVVIPDGGVVGFSADTVAAAGSDSSDAAALSDQVTVVTGADGAKGVVLPAAADLEERTVINYSPTYAVKVYPVDSGDDKINELAANQPFILYPNQKLTFKAVSATQWYTERARPVYETHFEVFDDFLGASIDTTDNWVVFAGGDGDATAGAITGTLEAEGAIVIGSGDAGDATDGSVLSLISADKASLVSLGTTVFEARVSFDQITGVAAWFGLADAIATDDEHLIHTVDSDTVADGGLTVTDAVGFAFSTDATAPDKWQYTSENNGTIGNSAAEEASSNGPTADTYDVLRIEVDADGDARFYLNGVLETTRATAVNTTATLVPYIGLDSGTDAQTVTDLTVDYILFQGGRTSDNS
jgi:hypothetical protein